MAYGSVKEAAPEQECGEKGDGEEARPEALGLAHLWFSVDVSAVEQLDGYKDDIDDCWSAHCFGLIVEVVGCESCVDFHDLREGILDPLLVDRVPGDNAVSQGFDEIPAILPHGADKVVIGYFGLLRHGRNSD